MGNSCSGDKQRASYLDTIDNERERNVVAAKSLHEGSIRDLSFINAHGSRPNCLISCSDDGTMLSSSVSDLLASVEATQCKFTGHKKGINKLSVVKGHLWSASRDLSIKQWDINTGECVQTLSNIHELNIAALDTHATSNQVASGSRDYSVKLWDIETATCLREFTARRNVVTCLSYAGKYSGSANVLYQGGEDLCIKAWDSRLSGNGKNASLVLGGFVYFPTSLCVHPSVDHLLASGCKGFNGSGAELKCWDIRSPTKPVVEFLGHTHDVTSCTFVQVDSQQSDDGFPADCVLSCSKDGSIGLWNMSTKEKLAFASGLNKHFTSIVLIPKYDTTSFSVDGVGAKSIFNFAISAYDGSVMFCSVVKVLNTESGTRGLPYIITVDTSTLAYVTSLSENDIIDQ